jgi:hypothetical protein
MKAAVDLAWAALKLISANTAKIVKAIPEGLKKCGLSS